MQKITKEQMLSELMIKLETIDGKLDKLLNSDLRIINNVSVVGKADPDSLIEQIKASMGDCVYNEKPTRWPNESYEDYLKRIGEYNTAQSDEEIFREEMK
jgi:hypothetical protein